MGIKLKVPIIGWIKVVPGKLKDWMSVIQLNYTVRSLRDGKMVRRNTFGKPVKLS